MHIIPRVVGFVKGFLKSFSKKFLFFSEYLSVVQTAYIVERNSAKGGDPVLTKRRRYGIMYAWFFCFDRRGAASPEKEKIFYREMKE